MTTTLLPPSPQRRAHCATASEIAITRSAAVHPAAHGAQLDQVAAVPDTRDPARLAAGPA